MDQNSREYIFALITTLKLTEKEICSLENEAAKWKNRTALARSRGIADLLAEAEREAERINTKLAALKEEERSLRDNIETMRRQLPGLAARERSIDPDLLEQELLMALGRDEKESEIDRAFEKLEKESAADAALEALKDKMKEEKQ
jgi:phage shock protein A